MRWKTTLVLLLLTVGIGAYVSLYELKQPSPEEREQLSKRVLSLDADTVSQIALDLPQAKLTLTREASMWFLAPQRVRANPELVNQFLNQLAPLSADRVLSGTSTKPLDVKAFGLEPAIGWITVVTKGSSVTLLIGDTTPVGNHRYVQIAGRPEIFVVSASLLDEVNKSINEFRDPLLIRADPWMADEFTLTTADRRLALIRQERGWRLTQPFSDQADRSDVNELINHLAAVRIQRFVDDAPQVERLADWGFDQPQAELILHQRTVPPAATTLFFGKPLPDNAQLIYAKRSDEPSLYAVNRSDVEALSVDPHGLRNKACFEFFSSSVRKIEVVKEAHAWAIEQTNGQWRTPQAAEALDGNTVEEFLSKLSDLRLSGFVEDAPSDLGRYGLAPPWGTITVWTTGSESPQTLSVGSVVEESANRYGRIEGREAVVRLPDLITELLSTAPDQLRQAPPTPRQPSPSSPRNSTPTAK